MSSSEQQIALRPDEIVDFFEASVSRPMSAETVAREMDLPESRLDELQQHLERLVDQGRLVKTRHDRYGLPEKMNLVVGRLSCHQDGYGFVVPDGDTEQRDLFIPGGKLGEAMHEDRVVARIEHVRKSGKPEGRVIRVLERSRTSVVGKFQRSKNFGYVVPLDRRMVHDVYVPEGAMGDAAEGQVVYAEITDYPETSRNPEGRIVDVLGSADDPRVDVEIVIREYELPHEFPDEVLAEADRIPSQVTEDDVEDRTDFRDRPIVTIDGENAQDFDDAVEVEKLANGNYRLSVHIADVAAYVPVGSQIDVEARNRGTSVYFPRRVVPMLPENLSNEICSLRPGVDRLAHSVVIEIDGDGRSVNYEFHDSVIRSVARMTYTEVAAIVEDDDQEVKSRHAEHVEHFRRMEELCRILMGYRRSRGGLDFDLPEPEVLINLRGEVESIHRSERNFAHRIIEEFMIRANEVVASHLTWEDEPCIYRVHEGPDLEKVEQFREFVSGLGLTLGGGDDPEPADFQRLIELLDGRPEQRVISMLMLRTMKQARYQPDNIGHFGLASDRYCHFTSPIRRYPDLVVHRLLKADRNSDEVPEFPVKELVGELTSISEESSQRERKAEEAEREYLDWKKVKFMADKVGETFTAYVTGVQSFGFFVELEPYFVEGLVHVSSLNDDYYRWDEGRHHLQGENTGRTFTLGDKVKVQVAKVDIERRRLDFALIEGPLEKPEIEAAEKEAEKGKGKEADGKRAEKAEKGGDGSRRRRKGRGRRRKGGEAEAEGGKQAKADEKKGDAEKGGKKRRRRGRRGGGKGQQRRRASSRDSGDRQEKAARQKEEARQEPSSQEAAKGEQEKEKAPARRNPYLTEIDL